MHDIITNLQHLDPLVWTVVLGAFSVWVQSLVKRFVSLTRRQNYTVATLLAGLVGLLTAVQQSGVLSKIHNPLLATCISAAISYLIGANVYGFYTKTVEEAKANEAGQF